MNEIKEFYSKLKFPGPYTIEDLEFYDDIICNDYLKMYDNYILGASSVLDVGCGSGLITNFLARRHPHIQFDAVDFSDSIDYAMHFSEQHNITNITYYKQDFLLFDSNRQYDVVFSNGVVHHIPEYQTAIDKIKKLSANKIVIGIYNTYGKIFKNYLPVKYGSEILYLDQEHCPFEMTFTDKEFKIHFNDYNVLEVYPSCRNKLVDFVNLFNYNNGGLTIYVFQNSECSAVW